MSIAKKIYNLLTGKNIRSSSTRTYYCPKCQTSVRATKTVNIICGDCNETMVERTINLTLKANSDVRESVD